MLPLSGWVQVGAGKIDLVFRVWARSALILPASSDFMQNPSCYKKNSLQKSFLNFNMNSPYEKWVINDWSLALKSVGIFIVYLNFFIVINIIFPLAGGLFFSS
jgi:hypothetical protein